MEGFNFQFPVMKGFLSKSCVDADLSVAGLATKADAEVARATVDAMENFILITVRTIDSKQNRKDFESEWLYNPNFRRELL